MKKSAQPHARVLTALEKREQKKRIVFQIAERMAVGEWCTGEMLDLCDVHGVSKSTMEHNAAEASRLLEYTTHDRERLSSLVKVRMNQILQQDGNDRVRAGEILLKTIGALEDRVRVTQMDREQVEQELSQMLSDPSDELAAALERHGWRRFSSELQLAPAPTSKERRKRRSRGEPKAP